MSTQRKKHESGKKDIPDVAQTTNKTRHKRRSTSQTAVSTLEESIQCNGLSTSSIKTPKSRSLSTLSSSEIGGQRRSARLSQMESQQTSPEKKKKKNDDQKTNKDKRKSGLNVSVEKGSEKYVYKRTNKLKDNTETFVVEKDENSDEGEEPAEKRSKRNSGRHCQNEIEESSEEEKNNESESEKHSSTPLSKLIRKQSKKGPINEPSYVGNLEDCDKTATNSSSNQDIENREQILKASKQKKSTSSQLSSSVEKIIKKEKIQYDHIHPIKHEYLRNELQSKEEMNDDVPYDTYKETEKNEVRELKKRGKDAKLSERQKGETVFPLNSEGPTASLKSSKVTLVNNSHTLKMDMTTKKSMQTKSNLSSNKEDLVLEYNRSISEKISLLKPKAFVGRTSASFRKNADDQNEGSGQEIDSDAESRRAIMESAQRRIEQNLSTSESDSRYFRGMHTPIAHSSKNDSSDSDSAPETLSFAGARQEAMESIKSAAEHVKREKQRLKERRKARLEMLKQQKEEKLIRLKEKMASQEDASCSSSEESGYEEEIRNARLKLKKKKAKSKAQHTEKENLDDATGQISLKPHSGAASDDSSDEIAAAQEVASLSSIKRMKKEMFQAAPETVRNSKLHKLVSGFGDRSMPDDKNKNKKTKTGKVEEMDKKDRGFKSLTSLDYIPLSTEGATKFMVVPLDKAMRAPKSLAEEAADFRQNMLYGSRIKREPAKNIKAYQQKVSAGNLNFHVR